MNKHVLFTVQILKAFSIFLSQFIFNEKLAEGMQNSSSAFVVDALQVEELMHQGGLPSLKRPHDSSCSTH